jgi:nicotinamidase-related amidase
LILLEDLFMKQPRISNSPLLDPAFCALVLLSPEALDRNSVDQSTHATCKRAIDVLLRAARIAEVPVFHLAHDPEQKSSASSALQSVPSELRFGLEQHRSPWAHRPFVEALAAQDRTILILAGLWFEHEILAVALNALVDGYDVYVLLDGSAHRSHLASVAARERLTQAGGTLITTGQVISEWASETADAAVRGALMAHLPVLVDLN